MMIGQLKVESLHEKMAQKYFIDTLIINPNFKGELILIGQLDHYFNSYIKDKKQH